MSINLSAVPRLTKEELAAIAVHEEFLLFCDEDEFIQIAEHIEQVVRSRIAAAHKEAP